ncbi:hypothetical protein Vau01_005390 [Virgisporangium aurantiacum]|uniref:Uncharacterized protein n=1 Tax=Virgisporangium aurantiacum TaxID=175570 RepID=A0A8J4DX68_9ACTN|nr:hypothetical protein Vau01_005390 [Virgisporangium aurantiacum]
MRGLGGTRLLLTGGLGRVSTRRRALVTGRLLPVLRGTGRRVRLAGLVGLGRTGAAGGHVPGLLLVAGLTGAVPVDRLLLAGLAGLVATRVRERLRRR